MVVGDVTVSIPVGMVGKVMCPQGHPRCKQNSFQTGWSARLLEVIHVRGCFHDLPAMDVAMYTLSANAEEADHYHTVPSRGKTRPS